MRRFATGAAAVVLLVSSAFGAADAPKIIAGPTVAGNAVSFTVSAPCDVTVRVVDAKGEVIRHLAAGMVGLEKAASPLAPKSLSQTIAWDGKDDAGKDAPPGCKVVVSVGMRAKFDKFILWEKDAAPRSRSNNTCTAPDGTCWVNQSAGTHLDTLRLFTPDGKLVREVWPPTLNRPKEVLEKFFAGKWGATDWDGDRVPLKVTHNSWYVYGVRSGGMAPTTDGYLVSICNNVGQGIFVLDPNDFPAQWQWNPPWYVVREQSYKTRMSIVAGTDGDFYLGDDFRHVVGHFRAKDCSPINSFTHNGPQALPAPGYVLGELNKPGDDDAHFQKPTDLALDAQGNLSVLDVDKVKVYAKDGKFIKEAPKAEFPTRPVPPAVKATEKDPRAIVFPQFLKVTDAGRLIVMNYHNEHPVLETDVDGKTVKPIPMPWATEVYHGYSAFDAEGNWYVVMSISKKPQAVWKFSPDGKRAKIGAKDEVVIAEEGSPFTLSKGIAVARNGDVYVVTQTSKWTQKPPGMTGGAVFGDLGARGEGICQTRVDVWTADGTLKARGIVKSVGINDVALDREGNIYVIDGTMWHGAQMAGVATGASPYGKKAWPFSYLTPEQAALDPKTDANKRYSLLTRLVKFPSAGGVLDDAGDKTQLWSYAGLSGCSPWNCDAECPASQICVDPDQRLWACDSFMYCVKVVDRAGNFIARFGKYGNEQNLGGGGDKRHPEMKDVVVDPEIPLACPKGVAVRRDSLFIADQFAHRVMRCRIEYADTKEAALQ